METLTSLEVLDMRDNQVPPRLSARPPRRYVAAGSAGGPCADARGCVRRSSRPPCRAGGRRATGSLALQRLRRVSVVARTVTRERDSRPPPPWVLCRQLHRPAIFVLLFAFRVILSPDARSALSTICRECHGLVRVAHRAKTRAAKTLLHYL